MTRLISATVQRRANDVVLAWQVEGDLEAESSSWLLSCDLIGENDGPIHRLGFRFRDGMVEVPFVFDHVAAMNYYLPDVHPQRIGDTWEAVLPAGGEVARSGEWRAALSFEGPDNSNESSVEGTF